MEAALELRFKHAVDQPVDLDTVLAAKRLGDDADAEVGLPFRPRPGVALVKVGLVDHMEGRRAKGFVQAFRDSIDRTHRDFKTDKSWPRPLVGRIGADNNRKMDLNSKYFDRIRINPGGERVEADEVPTCEWEGCRHAGGYRAPKGRQHEGQYHNFCLQHVREYNKKYNYFAGMQDDDIRDYQRSASTGHRPTWNMGVNRDRGAAGGKGGAHWAAFTDPFGFFNEGGHDHARKPEPEKRPLGNFERRSFEVLDLEGTESGTEIKARYKELVKRHHPDANGGDRSLEDRLREIIQAYNYLKSAGFC